jgi:hypothetical protein
VDEITVPRALAGVYVLRRVRPDGGEETVSEHPDFGSGWSAGTAAVHADRENAYALYEGSQRVARFAQARLIPRSGAERIALALGG